MNMLAKLCVISLFAKTVRCLPPKHVSRTNSRNIIGRNPSMVIPLLANQDLTPMLLISLSTATDKEYLCFSLQKRIWYTSLVLHSSCINSL